MKILTFGTFDHFHPGHEFILSKAQEMGDLFVLIARDCNVEHIKGFRPDHTEEERRERVQQAYPRATVILGDEEDYLRPVREISPDRIVLGYDQQLPPGISETDLGCEVVRLEAYEPKKFKSSILRKEAQEARESSFAVASEDRAHEAQEGLWSLIEKDSKKEVMIIQLEDKESGAQRVDIKGKKVHVLLRAAIGVRGTVSIVVEQQCSDLSIEAIIDDGAQVNCLLFQNTKAKTIAISQRSTLGDGATLHWHNVSLGRQESRHDFISTLEGGNACSSVDWIFYARDNEQQQISARNVFNAPCGTGEMTLRGVAQETAQVHCNGMIDIGPHGGGTDTYLHEDVLMLDPTAKVDAIPGLEIKTNDVKASHSATVSRVTEEDLFYFGARGIDAVAAKQMYVQGFLGDLTARIVDGELRGMVVQEIEKKYGA